MTALSRFCAIHRGEWKSGNGKPVLNPADERSSAPCPRARTDLDAALAAAEAGWRYGAKALRQARARFILKARRSRAAVEEMAVAMQPSGQADRAIAGSRFMRVANQRMGRERGAPALWPRLSRASREGGITVLRQPIGRGGGRSRSGTFDETRPARSGGPYRAGCPYPKGSEGNSGGRGADRQAFTMRAGRRACSIRVFGARRRFTVFDTQRRWALVTSRAPIPSARGWRDGGETI